MEMKRQESRLVYHVKVILKEPDVMLKALSSFDNNEKFSSATGYNAQKNSTFLIHDDCTNKLFQGHSYSTKLSLFF